MRQFDDFCTEIRKKILIELDDRKIPIKNQPLNQMLSNPKSPANQSIEMIYQQVHPRLQFGVT